MSSTCKPAISTSITLNQTSIRPVFSREHTYVKTLTKIIFDLLQWQEICNAVTAKKGCHRYFHPNNISRAFSPRSQWHYPKWITCHFLQSMRRHFSPLNWTHWSWGFNMLKSHEGKKTTLLFVKSMITLTILDLQANPYPTGVWRLRQLHLLPPPPLATSSGFFCVAWLAKS